jgi:hypothetical protein
MIFLHPCDGPFADGNVAIFLALALTYQQHSPVEGEVVELQRDHFHAAHSGRVQQLDHGPVAQPDRVVDVAELEDAFDLLGGEDVLGKRLAETWQLQLGGRVMQQMIPPGHPSEPHPQRHEARVLGTEAHRLPVLLAIEEEIPLVTLEHWPGDLDGIGEAALFEPCEEEADMPRAAPHRELGVVLHFERMEMIAHEGLERRPDRGLRLAPLLYAGHRVASTRCPLPFMLRGCTATTRFSPATS